MKFNTQHLLESLRHSTILTAVLLVAILALYLFVEPTVSHSQTAREQFTISQDIGAEISFLTPPANVDMGSVAGITGGTANGFTHVRVQTNDVDGYTMTIQASSSPAMQGESQGGEIPDYTPGTSWVPDYAHSVGANTAEFAYTISATTSSDLAQKFLDDGAANCNEPAGADTNGSDSCWYSLFTTATSVINRASQTESSGSTSTIFFRTQVTSNPVPALPQDTYTATATLTATVN